MKQEFVHYVGQLLRLKEKELIIAQNTEASQKNLFLFCQQRNSRHITEVE